MKVLKKDYEKEVAEEKSRTRYEREFSGARSTRKAEIKSLKESQLEEGGIQKVNYKTGIAIPENLTKETQEAQQAKHRFLRNVARVIKIAQLERKACEEELTDTEKLQLIKLDREFDVYNVVLTLEREQAAHTEALVQKGIYEPPFKDGEGRKQTSTTKIQLGGKSEGKELQLKTILIRHKKAIGWSEEVYKQKIKSQAGKKGGRVTARLSKERKRAGKKGIGGRKKGLTFDARVMKYITAKEKGELDKNE